MTKVALAVAVGVLLGLSAAAAQAPSGPYAGKTVQLVIGFGPGGGYDAWGRIVGRHISKHLPGNPTVVPQNMPGAGSFVAANHLYNVAPKDGTVFGIIARDAPLGPLSKAPGVRFDATKFSWLGTPTKETNVCIVMSNSAVKSVADLAGKELILGDTGPGTGTRTFPKVLNGLLGWKMRLVSGFPASTDVFLAMERGEVEGICESYDSVKNRKRDWITSKKINILFQGGEAPSPELKDVPFVLDLAKTPEQKQALQYIYAGQGIGRPFAAPPGLPPERLKMLRDAFNATMKDPDFIAEAKKLNLDVEPETGEHLDGLIKEIYATPEAVIAKVADLIK